MPVSATPVARRIGGRYTLGDALGSGGMGTVWQAYDELLNRPVAVKELHPPRQVSPEEKAELRARSLREARAAARISSPAVVAVHDVVEQDDCPWIVMELLEGRSLAHVLRFDGPLPVDAVARIGLAVLTALEAAHGAGVVHRDVKPANVLMARDGRIALTDFGVATVGGETGATATGMVLGSPAYMAPERARSGVPDPAIDLWGLGATLFAAVEGRGPFHRHDARSTLNAVMTEPIPPAHRAGLLRPVIDGLLEREPGDRLPAPAVRMLLEEVLRQHSGATAAARPERAGPAAGRPVLDVTDLDTAALALQQTPPVPADVPTAASPASPSLAARKVPRWAWPVSAAVGAGVLLSGALVGGVWASPGEQKDAAAAARSTTGVTTATQTAATPTTYTGPEGFRVDVPVGWQVEPFAGGAYLREPGTRRFVAVRRLGRVTDLAAAVKRQRTALAARLPGYAVLPLSGSVSTDRRGTEFEFSWRPEDGGPLRVRVLALRLPSGPAYSLYLSSSSEAWPESQAAFRSVESTFRSVTD